MFLINRKIEFWGRIVDVKRERKSQEISILSLIRIMVSRRIVNVLIKF